MIYTVKNLTTEQREQVVELFTSGNSPLKIEQETGISRKTVYAVLDEAGIERRHKTVSKSKGSKYCPHCRRTGHPKGARFCWHCGGDIRSEAEILGNKLQHILPQVIQILPESMKTDTSDILQAVVRYLDGEAKK